MTIETSYASHSVRLLGLAIGSGIELLLRKLSHQQPQAFELLGIQNAVEKLVVIINSDYLPFGNIAQIGASGQEDRRWEFRQKPVRQIKVHVKAFQAGQRFYFSLWKDHTAYRMIDVRQRQIGEDFPFADLFRRHLSQLFPGHAVLESGRGPYRDG